MATIPLGNYDLARAVPRTQPSRVDNSGALAAGRAIEQAGQVGMQVSGQLLAQQAAERRAAEQQDEALARAKAANAVAEQRLQVQATAADIEDQLRRGADYKQASTMYEEAIGKIDIPTIEGLPPEAAEMYQGGIAQARMAGRLSLDNMVVSARRDAGQQQFAQLLDTLGKQAGVPGADVAAVNETAKAALPLFREFGLDGSTMDKAVQEFADKNWSNQALQRYNMGRDDIASLEQLQRDLTTEDGGYAGKLDADTRNSIALRVGGRLDALQSKAQSAADRTDAAAERALAQMDQQAATGIPSTIEQQAAWAGAIGAASPQFRQQYDARIRQEREIQGLLRQPIATQTQVVHERQAALFAGGGSLTDVANFNRLKSAVEGNLRLMTEQPLQYAAARMGEDIKPIPLDDPANIGAAIAGTIQHRQTVIEDMRRRFGPQVQSKLLLPQEAEVVTTTLNRSTPSERARIYGALRRTAGSDDAYVAIMGQVAEGAPLASMAGVLHLRNPKAAELVTLGDSLLSGDSGRTPKMPTGVELDEAISYELGSVFRGRPEAYALARQAVLAAYAGAVAKDGDTSGQLDVTRLTNVVHAVVGRTVDFNGRGEVFVPYGTDPDQFEDRVSVAWDLQKQNIAAGAPTDLDVYGLQSIGDGRYYVTAGRSFLQDRNGRPFVLDLTPGAR